MEIVSHLQETLEMEFNLAVGFVSQQTKYVTEMSWLHMQSTGLSNLQRTFVLAILIE